MATLRRVLIWGIAATALIGVIIVAVFVIASVWPRRAELPESPSSEQLRSIDTTTSEGKAEALELLAGSSTPAELTPAEQWQAAQPKAAELDRLAATSSSESQVSTEDKFKALDSLKKQP